MVCPRWGTRHRHRTFGKHQARHGMNEVTIFCGALGNMEMSCTSRRPQQEIRPPPCVFATRLSKTSASGVTEIEHVQFAAFWAAKNVSRHVAGASNVRCTRLDPEHTSCSPTVPTWLAFVAGAQVKQLPLDLRFRMDRFPSDRRALRSSRWHPGEPKPHTTWRNLFCFVYPG